MLLNKYELTIKKSKFIAFLYKIEDEKEVKEIINNLKKENTKAKHFPYAYIIDSKQGKSDDKEPHNSAGMQIYNQLIYHNLNSHLIVIVRYFGGTKLGSGNLLRTYLTCAKNVIENNIN